MTRHVCPCGAVLRCSQEPDQCEHGVWWTCDDCLERQIDDYFSQLEDSLPAHPQPTAQEMTRHESK